MLPSGPKPVSAIRWQCRGLVAVTSPDGCGHCEHHLPRCTKCCWCQSSLKGSSGWSCTQWSSQTFTWGYLKPGRVGSEGMHFPSWRAGCYLYIYDWMCHLNLGLGSEGEAGGEWKSHPGVVMQCCGHCSSVAPWLPGAVGGQGTPWPCCDAAAPIEQLIPLHPSCPCQRSKQPGTRALPTPELSSVLN